MSVARTVPVGADLPRGLHIGGRSVEASDGGTFEVTDPATDEVIAEVANGTVDDATAAVAAADAAGPAWAATPPRERAEVLRRAFDLVLDREEEVARLIVREGGKGWGDALGEVRYAAEFFRWYSEEAVRAIGSISRAPSGDKRIVAVYEPVGVSILVTPWNFPAAMATRKIAPALAAGCTVVLKPASDTPLTALLVADILAEAGVPGGVVNVLPSRRSSATVTAMLSDPRTRALSFTGSTEVGRTLLGIAADRVLRCSMELGGNAPFVVFADADLDAAVEGAMVAKMRNGGESCIAANRFYVQRPVVEEFGRKLAERMGALRVGSGLEPGTDVGPLINPAARDDVDRLVRAVVDAGADVLVGGRPGARGACYYEPTVITGVPADAPILREEIFGPVAPIVAFDTEDEAVAWSNDTIYGLAAYVYSGDLATALRVAERIDAGMVGINRGSISDPAAPFGGVRQSGLGREGAHEGLLEFLETKYIAVDW